MKPVPSSFRDPSGVVYEAKDGFYRTINPSFRVEFEYFTNCGLYDRLLSLELIIPFEETKIHRDNVWKTIRASRIPFISYPYEWCFSQLKEAALVTLQLQQEALKYGMILKDASAYNVQLTQGMLKHIDHLSFERYEANKPWVAYQQFVKHFLGPLTLMAKSDLRYGLALRNYIDGLPLDYISEKIPKLTWFNIGVLLHIHLHAWLQQRYSDPKTSKKRYRIPKRAVSLDTLIGLNDSLIAAVTHLRLPTIKTEWSEYYQDNNYNHEAFNYKKEIVTNVARKFNFNKACDLGANAGIFS